MELEQTHKNFISPRQIERISYHLNDYPFNDCAQKLMRLYPGKLSANDLILLPLVLVAPDFLDPAARYVLFIHPVFYPILVVHL